LLKIVDKDGRTKYVLRDEDDEPLSIDELILRDKKEQEADAKEKSARS
jgi:hypothetical protein